MLDLMSVVGQREPKSIIIQSQSGAVFTFVAAVEDVWESVGALEVEKGGDREDQEQAD